MILPAARGHEYVRIGRNGIRAKLGIDATVPFEDRHRFARCAFAPVAIDKAKLSRSGTAAARWLSLPG
jgi:2,5-furandicarboxylate decarboxylase 1